MDKSLYSNKPQDQLEAIITKRNALEKQFYADLTVVNTNTNTKEILKIIESVYALECNGAILKELCKSQKIARLIENDNAENSAILKSKSRKSKVVTNKSETKKKGNS